MIDFDRADILRRRRAVAAVAGAVYSGALVAAVSDIILPACFVLALSSVVFFVYVLTYSAELEEMRLVDPERKEHRTR